MKNKIFNKKLMPHNCVCNKIEKFTTNNLLGCSPLHQNRLLLAVGFLFQNLQLVILTLVLAKIRNLFQVLNVVFGREPRGHIRVT